MNDNPPKFSILSKAFLEGKHPVIQLIWIVLLSFGCGIVLTMFGMILAHGIWGDDVENPTASYYRFIQVFNAIGMFLVPALLFSYLQQNRWFSYNHANEKIHSVPAIVWVTTAALFILPVAGLLVEGTKLIPWPSFMSGIEAWMHEKQAASDRVLALLTADTHISTLLLNLLVCALLPAVCEEFFFRGSLQQLLHSWCRNTHITIWLTGFIFSAIHLQIDGFLARWLLGAYLGYLLVWSGSLWLPILAHFLHNAFSIILQHILLSNGEIPSSTITLSTVLYSFISLLFLVFLIYLIYKSLHKKQSTITE